MDKIIFLAKLLLIFLGSSETHFNPFTSKISAKHNDLVIYGYSLVNFLGILSIKSTISQNVKFGKLFFHKFQNIAHLLD